MQSLHALLGREGEEGPCVSVMGGVGVIVQTGGNMVRLSTVPLPCLQENVRYNLY